MRSVRHPQELEKHLDHQLKKKLIRARNRRNQLIFQHAEQHQQANDGLDLERQLEEERQAAQQAQASPDNSVDDVVWSAKMQTIKNRLNNKRKMAKGRWNRFSGTEAAGGQGR